MLRHLMFVAGIGFLAVIAAVIYAQDMQNRVPQPEPEPAAVQPNPVPPDRGGMYRGRGYDMNSRVLERVRERLPLSEDEWAVLLPKLTPVVECQRELRRGMSAWSRFGWDDGSDTPMYRAVIDLSNTLASPDATNEQIQAKVDAFRQARGDLEKQLETSRATLREAVTTEEAATLTLLGILD